MTDSKNRFQTRKKAIADCVFLTIDIDFTFTAFFRFINYILYYSPLTGHCSAFDVYFASINMFMARLQEHCKAFSLDLHLNLTYILRQHSQM